MCHEENVSVNWPGFIYLKVGYSSTKDNALSFFVKGEQFLD
jgi:hypothetical protein